MNKKVINLNGLDKEKCLSPDEMKKTKGRKAGSSDCKEDPDLVICSGYCETWDGFSGICYLNDPYPDYWWCECRISVKTP